MIYCFSSKTNGVLGNTSFEELCHLFNETQNNIVVLEELILVLNNRHDYFKDLSSTRAFQNARRYIAKEIIDRLCINFLSHFTRYMCYKDSILGEHVSAAEQYIKNIRRDLEKLCSLDATQNSNLSEVLLRQTKRALAELLSFGFEQFEIRSVTNERLKGLQVHSDVVFETGRFREDQCLKVYRNWIERIKKYVIEQPENIQSSVELN
jgi:hypothetical protein